MDSMNVLDHQECPFCGRVTPRWGVTVCQGCGAYIDWPTQKKRDMEALMARFPWVLLSIIGSALIAIGVATHIDWLDKPFMPGAPHCVYNDAACQRKAAEYKFSSASSIGIYKKAGWIPENVQFVSLADYDRAFPPGYKPFVRGGTGKPIHGQIKITTSPPIEANTWLRFVVAGVICIFVSWPASEYCVRFIRDKDFRPRFSRLQYSR